MPGTDYLPLPIEVDEITADWLTAAFRTRAPGVTIRDFEVVDTIFTTCSKLRLRLDRDEAALAAGIPETVIVKGGFQEHGRKLYQMHWREVRGYRDVYPEIPLPHPRTFFAEFDDARRQGIIIMEDLVAKGVEFCHASKPQSHEQVARRLTMLARFHAASWDSPMIKPGGKFADLPDFFDVMQDFFDDKASPENWRRFVESPRGAAASVRFHDRDWMVQSWQAMRRYSDSLPHSLLHGDIHLGNLYIEQDGTPGFLDTLASHGPPLMEISYHIAASIDSADRPRWEGALIQHYLDEAKAAGAPVPGFDEAMHQYAVFQIYGHFIWMTTESHYQAESVNAANTARVSATMLAHQTSEKVAAL